MIPTLILFPSKWGHAEGPGLPLCHRLSEYLQLPLESLAPNVPGETVTPLWSSVLLFLPTWSGIQSLLTGFAHTPWVTVKVHLEDLFVAPTLKQESQTLIRLIPTFHLLSRLTTYSFCAAALLPAQAPHSLFLCSFVVKFIPSAGICSNLTFSGSLLGLCLSLPSQSCPVLSSQQVLLSVSGVALPDLSPYCTTNFSKKQIQSETCEHISSKPQPNVAGWM